MLKSLCEVFAPSGMEMQMREYIKECVKDVFDQIQIDNLGNLVARKNGSERSLCIECGMDSCGVMVTSKTDDKAYFSGIGGVSAAYLNGKKVFFKDGNFGIIRYDGKNAADAKVTDLYIATDTQGISIGDFGVIADEYCENSKNFFANGIASKVALAAVLQAVKTADTDKGYTVLFSAQRRFAAKGIQTFFTNEEFDRVITVDGISCESGIKCGGGCAIIAVDSRGVSDKGFREETENISTDREIKFQTAVTDENMCIEAVSTSGRGANCVALGIPVTHKGKNYESVLKSDFNETVKLIKTIIEEF